MKRRRKRSSACAKHVRNPYRSQHPPRPVPFNYLLIGRADNNGRAQPAGTRHKQMDCMIGSRCEMSNRLAHANRALVAGGQRTATVRVYKWLLADQTGAEVSRAGPDSQPESLTGGSLAR